MITKMKMVVTTTTMEADLMEVEKELEENLKLVYVWKLLFRIAKLLPIFNFCYHIP